MTSHDQAEAFVRLLPEGVMRPEIQQSEWDDTQLSWEKGNLKLEVCIFASGEMSILWEETNQQIPWEGYFSGTEIPQTLLERIREISR